MEGKWSAFPRLREEQEILLPADDIYTSNLSQTTLDFIIEDDADQLRDILAAMSAEGRRQFLSGDLFQIRVKPIEKNGQDRSKFSIKGFPQTCFNSSDDKKARCNLKNPFILAAVYGSQSVLKCMIANGSEVLQMDSNNYNVIHALVYTAYLQASLESEANGTLLFLKEQISHEQFKKLLLSENSDGLRPLEMAAHLGTFLLFHTIFETKGVYLTRESVQGIYTTQWFDVTEYESCEAGSRRAKSPLLCLTLIEKNKVTCPHARTLLTQSPAGLIMRKWIEIKLACGRPLTLAWFILRTFNIAVFFMSMTLSEGLVQIQQKRTTSASNRSTELIIVDTDLNTTSTNETLKVHPNIYSEKSYGVPVPYCLLVLLYLTVFSLLSIIIDITEFICMRYGTHSWLLCTPKGRKKLAVHYHSYRQAHFSMSISIFLVSLLVFALKGDLAHIPRIIDHIFLIHALGCIVVSLKFFFQTTACLGPFIITFERMIKHLTCFVLVFLFFVLPYTFVFRHIVCDEEGNALCEQHFSTLVDAFYTVFTVTLNMVNFSTFQGVKYRLELFVVHIQFVFVIVMLLLNFLIAQFTRSLANVMDNSHIIMPIQRLSLVWTSELRFSTLLRAFYRFMHKRFFIHVDGRMYVARTMIVHKPQRKGSFSEGPNKKAGITQKESLEKTREETARKRNKSHAQMGSFPFPL